LPTKNVIVAKRKLTTIFSCQFVQMFSKVFIYSTISLALSFWDAYPSPQTLSGVIAENLAALLRQNSHNSCSTKKAEAILDLVEKDVDTTRAYQETRDFIIRSIAGDIRARQRDIAETEKALRQMLDVVDCKLETMPGVDTVTAAALIANVGDARRFGSADKLARFAGVAPVRFSSAGKGKDQKSKQGNRPSALPSLARPALGPSGAVGSCTASSTSWPSSRCRWRRSRESPATRCSTTTTSGRSRKTRPRSRPWCA